MQGIALKDYYLDMAQKSTVKKLALASMVSQFSISMVNFALVYFLRGKGFSSSEIGIAASIYPLCYLVFCLLFPKILPCHSNKREIVLSYAGMFLSVVGVILSPGKALTFLALSCYGIAMALLWPNMETWITSGCEGNELNKAVSSFNFAWSFGAGVSTFVGGVLAEKSASLPLYIAIAIFLALLSFVMTIKSREGEHLEEAECIEDHSTPLRYFCWIGILLLYSGYSLIINIYPLYALEKLFFSESLTGTLLVFRGVTACIAFILIGKFSFWQFKASSVIISQVLFIALVAVMGFIKSPVVYAIYFVIFGLDFSFVYMLSIFHGASGAKDREKRMVIHEVLLTVGTVLGSLFGGIIYENFTFQSILNAIFAISLVTLAAEIPLMKRTGCFTK